MAQSLLLVCFNICILFHLYNVEQSEHCCCLRELGQQIDTGVRQQSSVQICTLLLSSWASLDESLNFSETGLGKLGETMWKDVEYLKYGGNSIAYWYSKAAFGNMICWACPNENFLWTKIRKEIRLHHKKEKNRKEKLRIALICRISLSHMYMFTRLLRISRIFILKCSPFRL
jgi:hypothetical protein